ncbi:hypothetical protein B0I35DRAFT_412089 [Stachybotrys elegans]|uniref:DUF6536 domain-containing protein n=1 Tax=Stachybotrys elegans TaxID=80388 RepID=A0A8K0WP56_9HYPO|nr:hypothetical protein B0I35DRAFT_412089 [Stachybotrys elegans]
MWCELAINIMSTLLLGASNNCAQLLSAPTRQDIDKAHSRGRWLDIGVGSVRNLRYIPVWRGFLWLILLLSSIPLHLAYNSVLFANIATNNYMVALVASNFLDGGEWTTPADTDLSFDWLKEMQKSAIRGTLSHLDNADCLRTYGNIQGLSDWQNLLLVAPASSDNRTFLDSWQPLTSNFHPLGTVGDAISNFLEQPDDTTTNLGPISMAVVRDRNWRRRFARGTQASSCSIDGRPRRWLRAASWGRWLVSLALFFAQVALEKPLVDNVLLANTPQVIYGVMTGVEPDELGRRRVGFSSDPVEPLVPGESYI